MKEKQESIAAQKAIAQNRLREFRIIPRVSQWQLALMSGVKQSRISLIENLLVKPTANEKKKLADALKIAIDEVFPNNAAGDRTNS